jgi:hypothetical protein
MVLIIIFLLLYFLIFNCKMGNEPQKQIPKINKTQL